MKMIVNCRGILPKRLYQFFGDLQKNWLIANIGLLMLLIGFMIWIIFMILITVFNIEISKDLSDLILKIGFGFKSIGGIIFGLGLFVFGDKPI